MAFPIAAALGFGSSILGGLFSKSSAKDSAEAANQFTREQLQNRHQWEVADLKKAGLNPILSAGGTPSIGGSAQAQTPDFASNANSAIQAGASRKIARESLDIQRSEAQSRINLNSAQAENQLAQADSHRRQQGSGYYEAQAGQLQASADQARQTIKFLESRGKEVDANVKRSLKELEVSNARIRHFEALVGQARSTSERNFAEAALAKARENSQGYVDNLNDALRQESVVRSNIGKQGARGKYLGTDVAGSIDNSAVGMTERFWNWYTAPFRR